MAKRELFRNMKEAQNALEKMRGWPRRRVVCVDDPTEKESVAPGQVFLVEVNPGLYLQDDGSVAP